MFQEEPTKVIFNTCEGWVSLKGCQFEERPSSEKKSVIFFFRWCRFYLNTANCVITGNFLNSGLLFPYLGNNKYFTGLVIKKAKIICSLISEYLWSQVEIRSPELSELMITSVVTEPKEEGRGDRNVGSLHFSTQCGVSQHWAGFFFFFPRETKYHYIKDY